MTRPPEYEQVAEWLNAINSDPRFLAERARRALGGIDLDGKTTAQIAEEYHARQIAECAHYERDLLERIRALKSGDFAVPGWCAEDAAQNGISLAEAIAWYRQDEIHAASDELDHLDCYYYAVRDEEIQAYWAGRADRAPARRPEPQVTRQARVRRA